MSKLIPCLLYLFSFSTCHLLYAQEQKTLQDLDLRYTNSIGMDFVKIEAGNFMMGSHNGDIDEKPMHMVEISKSFYVGVFEVTNEQYEKFDPEHKEKRGKLNLSKDDDEAVVFVNWHEAVAFTEWLSKKEDLPYRLLTEAEWEYAARAGTTTAYYTGDTLPESYLTNPRESWYPDKDRSRPDDIVDLTVGQTSPNPWGLHDMHGNVEEWTLDWYGPYETSGRVDPVGRAFGDFKITRGGSHSTVPYYLRSSNRMATLPDNKNWLIGLRVAIGEMPETQPLSEKSKTKLFEMGVNQDQPDLTVGPNPNNPYFSGPRSYIKLQATENGPFFYHNHQADITELPNGDLLAIWYTTKSETGRYLAQTASRLRFGNDSWEPASIFWDVPDRNDHGNALFWDGEETIYHFSGMSVAATWGPLAMLMRTSTDNGASWSDARLINPNHQNRNQVISSVIKTHQDDLIVTADAVTGGEGGTAIHISKDGGKTWTDPGGTIAGIHASVVQLKDDRLLAFGRGDNIDGKMPKSISSDMGKTWEYSASEFPPITSTQRIVLLRMKEGPLFFASFADNMKFENINGNEYHGSGLFAAVSYDEGETWPVKKLIAPKENKSWMVTARNRKFLWTPETAEPRGYLAGTVAKNGIVHLISTTQHYEFNLKWLETPPGTIKTRELEKKSDLATVIKMDKLPTTFSDGAQIFFSGNGPEKQTIEIQNEKKGELNIQNEKQAVWIDSSERGFGSAKAYKGATTEIKMRIEESNTSNRGVDLVAHLGDENKRFYHISVTEDAIYAFDGFSMVPIAQNMDNSSDMNIFRIAVGKDGLARIYKNSELLAIRSPAEYRHKQVKDNKPYLLWGATGSVEAIIEYVGYDVNGGFGL